MVNRKIQELLGVDVGAARIGIARGNTLARIAEPLKTVASTDATDQIKQLAKLHASQAVVVGLPRNLDGDETDQTRAVRQWAKQAQPVINLPFFWQDEALTSQVAEGIKSKTEDAGSDARAAAIILQDFLDAPEDDRVAV